MACRLRVDDVSDASILEVEVAFYGACVGDGGESSEDLHRLRCLRRAKDNEITIALDAIPRMTSGGISSQRHFRSILPNRMCDGID